MSLSQLSVHNVRSISDASLELSPGLNLLFGANGAGKTSLLESVFLLGRGRSFRTRNSERLIRRGESELRVVGRLGAEPSRVIGIGVTQATGTTARLNGQSPSSLAELSIAFPVQVIDPEVHKLIEEGAARRRRFLDWGVFHVEPGFASAWTRYARALKQRNAALRSDQSDIWIWDRELIDCGEQIASARSRLFAQLEPFWMRLFSQLLQLPLKISLHSGWDRSQSFSDALEAARPRDLERRTSTTGPHRCDLAMRIEQRAAREILSRGQQKLAAAALVLGQLEYLRSHQQLLPTLLLDDPAAELDRERLDQLVQHIRALGTQLIVTSLSPEQELLGAPDRVFHVEQGGVSRV